MRRLTFSLLLAARIDATESEYVCLYLTPVARRQMQYMLLRRIFVGLDDHLDRGHAEIVGGQVTDQDGIVQPNCFRSRRRKDADCRRLIEVAR